MACAEERACLEACVEALNLTADHLKCIAGAHVMLPCGPALASPPQAGLDSLGAVELRNVLTVRFGVELAATAVFDYPTVMALSRFISRQLAAVADHERSTPQGGLLPSDAATLAQQAAPCTDLLGVGCLYPGTSDGGAATSAAGLASFWGAAAAGANLQRLVPAQRWDLEWCYSTGPAPGRSYARFAAFIEVSPRKSAQQLAGKPLLGK